MSKNVKRTISYFLVVVFMFGMMSNINIVNAADITSPALTVSGPSATYVQDGGTVKYTLVYTDNVGVTDITLTRDDIILVGFTANTSATKNGNTVTVTAANVKATNNSVKYIIVNPGTAKDAAGNVANRATSDVFRMPEMVIKDTTAPKISISGPSSSTVYSGGNIEYTVTYSDNVAISSVSLNPSDITLNGFSASKNVSIISNSKAIISLTNIQGSEGAKSISIAANTAKDTSSNMALGASSNAFALVVKTVSNTNGNTNTTNTGKNTNTNTGKNTTSNQNESGQPTEETPTNTELICSDFGYIENTSLSTFSSWLKSKKDNTTNVQKYNYLANGEESIYFVDYYNGSNEDLENVNFKLTIPFDLDIKENVNNAKITESDNSTIIEWNIQNIKSKTKCRLAVKVKFNRDINLMNSNDISKIFYTELETKISENTTYSYLRQIFVDNSVTKVGTFADTLMFLDKTNSVRQNDEITRAELAKMIIDSGVIKLNYSLTTYREYNDSEKIPTYSRLAISNLKSMNLFNIEDNDFSPNNPIIRDDFYKIIVNLISSISENKIKVSDPVYINNELITNSDGGINTYSNYIMELTRLNILPEYKTTLKLDQYVKRNEALAIINAITFKSNGIVNYPEFELNYFNIDNLRYVYNFTSDNNTNVYNYNYDNNLNQKIVQ